MKAMICSDFITMKNSLGQLLILNVLIAVIITVFSNSVLAGTAALAVMIPFMYVLSIAAYDDMNGWQCFRLTLPLSRRQVVAGRYASTIIVFVACALIALIYAFVFMGVCSLLPDGAVAEELLFANNPVETIIATVGMTLFIALVVSAITLPLMLRFGMTKATRVIPVVLVLLLAGAIYLAGEMGIEDQLAWMLVTNGGELVFFTPSLQLALLGADVAALVLFVLSSLIAMQWYAARQF
ncbi:ABC-2 transporter permease [Anaerotardibacter muris]|uniref:ABC-2 transporter permease n=1 Tax=Anaerotardibacter muris TaxID=2941505 RepID=UPI00203F88EB|nr:ABC-2 transporter permease [Anaerotardibacter muris]